MSHGYSMRLVALNKKANRRRLGVKLGRACIAADISVAEVADELGVSRQTVYKWFAGASDPSELLAPAVMMMLERLQG